MIFRRILGITMGALALTAPAVSAAGRQPSAQDVNWLETSASGDRFEIVAGRLAEQRGTSPAVRRLGARLVRDHSRSLGELRSVARALGVRVPSAPTPSEVWEINVVRSFTGHGFDVRYASLEVKDHQQDISETSFEAHRGQDPQVMKLARQDLPMLRTHLRLSMAARDAL